MGRHGKGSPAIRKKQRSDDTECSPRPEGAAEQEAVLRRLDAAVGQLHGALQPNTLLMVYTGQVRPQGCTANLMKP